MKKFLKISLYVFLIITIVIFSAILIAFASVKDYNFQEDKLLKSSQTFEFYSDNGNLISTRTAGSNNEFIELNKLKNYTKNAFIAIEDRRFYSHDGIDYKRIVGALINNIKSRSYKEGASTITQQLVKNTHLSSEKTLKRKFAEIKIARQLEKKYSKEQILEFYLNTIYFGKGAYGIEDASKTYFNKSATNLTLNESALLAGIIKSPKKYSPYNNYELAINRKNLVLKSMLECGYITKETYLYEKSNEVTINQNNNKNVYSDYLDAVINEYERSDKFAPYNFGTVKIYTFLNEELQRELANISAENYQTSKIVVNSKNNGVIAYLANNSNLSRSPASTVKPWLIYAPMINDGYIKESSVIKDEKIEIGGYSPKNSNGQYLGNVTIKTAISKSLNVPAVKLLNGFTIDKINKYSKKMNLDVSNESLPMALGAINGGLTLKQLTDKYSVFNDNGNYTESSFIKSIYLKGYKIYEFKPKKVKVFLEETAYIISDALKDSVKNGTSKKLRVLPYEICAKTGTNGNENGNLDAISISYTSENIVGVWIYPEDDKMLPNSVSGSSYPTAVSLEIYNLLYKNGYRPKDFIVPKNIVKRELNKKALIESEVELLSDNGESFYYIKGSEPTENDKNYLKPEISSYSLTVDNNIVKLKIDALNANKLTVNKYFNGTKKEVFSGNFTHEITDILTNYGFYEYEIIVFNEYGYNSITLNKIKHDISSVDKIKDWFIN